MASLPSDQKQGYAKLAALFARFPQLMSLRKFKELSSLLLLYKQAELKWLERKLFLVAREDAGEEDLHGIESSWKKMQAAFEDGRATEQERLLGEIEKKLRSYHAMILRVKQIDACVHPLSHDLKTLQDWLSRESGGDDFLRSQERDIWQVQDTSDLITMNVEGDVLDTSIAGLISYPYHYLVGRHRQPDVDIESGLGRLWEQKDHHFSYLGTVVCSALSSIIPIASILTLYFVERMTTRLLIIALFTLAFSYVLQLVTRCRRAEIFAATMAFAAVQVVFLQGVGGYGTC